MRNSSGVYYLHADHLGTASLTTDYAGAVKHQVRHYPFGQLRWQAGADVSDYDFTGQRADSFGLLDYRARFYDPLLGRFVSADTVVPGPENPQAWNRYSYVGNNPLKYNDPSGNCWGFASGLRGIFYGTTCDNLDMAMVIATSPDATVVQKIGAGAYIGAEAVAHTVVAVGTGVAAVGCLTGAGTAICAGAGSAAAAVSADGDPTNEAIAVGNALSNAACADGDCTNEITKLPDAALSLGDRMFEFQYYVVPEAKNFTEWQASGLSGPTAGRFAQAFKEAMNNTSQIHFNLTGLNINRALEQGKLGFSVAGNWTNAELYLIKNTPDWFAKTIFYLNGNALSPEELSKLLGVE